MADGSKPWPALVRLDTRAPGPAWGRLALIVAIVTALGLLASGMVLPAIVPAAHLVKDTADHYGDIPPLPGFLPGPPERSTILAGDGSTLAHLYLNEDRTTVKLADVPKMVQQAVLAIEDGRFYEHQGVDYRGIARALVADATSGGISQGGSTLTQQYVKLVITGNEPTLERKVKEAVYALELEKRLGKDQILERYLNLAYFGDGVYGIATASEHFFGKRLAQLSLAEAASLAATIARPEAYNPTTGRVNLTRRNVVLDRMQALGYEQVAAVTAAKKVPLKLNIRSSPDRFPYFYTYIRSLLLTDHAYDKILGPAGSKQRARAVFQGGLKIQTTLLPRQQRLAELAVRRQLAPVGKAGPTGALASVDPATGAVLALVGGRDYGKSEVNLAVIGRGGQGYQPGSAFKPFFAVAALEQGLSPRLVLNAPSAIQIDSPTCGRRWTVRGGVDQLGGGGHIDMYQATARSVNTYYAQLAAKIGPAAGLEVARRMGITGIPPKNSKNYGAWAICSLVLGTKNVSVLDMAAAFGVLANDGVRCPQFTVAKITGSDGKVVYDHKLACRRVLTTKVARTANDMLQGGPRFGTGVRAQIGRPLAGKTGTAQNYTSSFFTCFTPQLATAVWVGNPRRPTPMRNLFHGGPVFGGTYPALIFKDYMQAALAGKPVRGFPAPPAPPTVEVPDLIGKPIDAALSVLRLLGFTISVSGEGGVVVSTDPKPGRRTGRGSAIEVVRGKKQDVRDQPDERRRRRR
jgi:membrane peptidoglycan carboxypeptidase